MARFDSLPFPVHKLASDEPVDKVCAKLFTFAEFKKLRSRADYNRLVKYIVYLYSDTSDLLHENKKLEDRKDAAAKEAGYERVLKSKADSESGKWPKNILTVMEMKDSDAHAAIMAYLKHIKNYIFTEICVCEQELEEFQKLRMEAIGGKKGEGDRIKQAADKDKLKEASDLRIKSLPGLYKEFYGDNDDVKKAEFEEMITPETAVKILESKPPWEEEKDGILSN